MGAIEILSQKMTGSWSRKLFWRLHLYQRRNYPNQAFLHWPGMRVVLDIGRACYGLYSMGWMVKRRFGLPLCRQIVDIVTLSFREGVDAMNYYLLELYRDPTYRSAFQCLTRFETKNGLFRGLNLSLAPFRPLSSPGDKLYLSRICIANNIHALRILLTIHGNKIEWHDSRPDSLEQDLFVKLRRGKGARGVEAFQWISRGFYHDEEKETVSLPLLLHRLKAKSKKGEYMLVPRLQNAPEIADLAETSLMPLRVITCLNERGEPEITHAMLRILGKLERKWPHPIEFGTAIDLESGTMGRMVGDKIWWHPLERFDFQPFTGARVTGRLLPYWPQIKEMVVKGHSLFPGYVVLGWDIGVTPDGPIVLEANVVPDVAFLQRVHNQSIGESHLGRLLNFHLRRLERAEAVRSLQSCL